MSFLIFSIFQKFHKGSKQGNLFLTKTTTSQKRKKKAHLKIHKKVKNSHTIIIQSGTGNQNIYDCSSGNSVISKTIETSTKRKITVTYSSTAGKWFLMADDFLS